MSKSRKSASLRPRRFLMEQLETRQMMAGDVAAYVQNGNLYINEAANQVGLANGVRVAQLTNGQIQVIGTESNDGTTGVSRVNGVAAQNFTVPGSLFVNLGGGNDRIQLGFSDGAGIPISTKCKLMWLRRPSSSLRPAPCRPRASHPWSVRSGSRTTTR